MRARSMFAEHSEVVRRGIAPMAGKPILGKFTVEFVHDPIAGDLGQNAGGGNAEAQTIPAHEGSLFHGESLHGESVDQGVSRRMSVFLQSIQGTPHRQMGGSEDIELSDFFCASL